jgi:DNA-binding XRE family transcriptional regulator
MDDTLAWAGDDESVFTKEQCRGARAMLRVEIRDLAAKANVSPATIVRFEKGEGLHPRTIAAIQIALQAEGAVFSKDGDRVCVTVRPAP